MSSKRKRLDIARLRWHSTVICGVVAALLYSSWPLGYILNPWVGRHELASELEAPHQPYAWIFITADVLTGVFIVFVGLLQLRTRKISRTLFSAVACYVLFGAQVAGAALAPLHCDPEVQYCGPLKHNPLLVVHGGFSILSVLCLFAATLIMASVAWRRRRPMLRALFAVVLLGWGTFGAGACLELYLHIRDNNVLQYFFITVCSISLALVVAAIENLSKRAPARQPEPLGDLAYNEQEI
ncbi:MAG TPA: DUF998 domain-containing protein [Candidatus Saccharimonadales bacterium]|nr:DUF998 domain-containing protein [Candidatus Saccharimonadales bacterium]